MDLYLIIKTLHILSSIILFITLHLAFSVVFAQIAPR